EVVDRDPRYARFVGDMPHTWVGTDFVRSVQAMLAYERETDSALVIAAGVPASWIADSALVVRGLQTRWGTVSYRLGSIDGHPRITWETDDLRAPPGGIYFQPPGLPSARRVGGIRLSAGAPAVTVDGRSESTVDPSYWHWVRTARNPMPHVIDWGHRWR